MHRTGIRSLTALFLTLLLLMGSVSAFWADAALAFATETGMLDSEDLRGADPATRAELAVMVTNLFRLTKEADLSGFVDITEETTDRAALARAVALGLLNGTDLGELLPDAHVTREQAFAILCRAFCCPAAAETALYAFHDAESISNWARPYAASLAAIGMIQGSHGALRPKDSISRQELAQILLNLSGQLYSDAYETGTVLIPAGGSLPTGTTIAGDLILCVDAEQSVTVKDLTVAGRILIRGSGSVTLTRCNASSIVTCDDNIHLTCDTPQQIVTLRAATLSGGAKSVETVAGTTFTSGIFESVTTTGSITIEQPATLRALVLDAPGIVVGGSGFATTVTLRYPDCNVQVRTQSQLDEIDYGLRGVTMQWDWITAPTADHPMLSAALTLSDDMPLPGNIARQCTVRWMLGAQELGRSTVRLNDTATVNCNLPFGAVSMDKQDRFWAQLVYRDETRTLDADIDFTDFLSTAQIETIQVQATMNMDATIFADLSLSIPIGWATAGETAIYTNYASGLSSKLVFPDGRTGWVAEYAISISDADYVRSNDYTTTQKEAYVNRSGYTSETGYMVWISLKCQRVNVFMGSAGSWKLSQSFPCSSGSNRTPTIAGVFKYQALVPMWDFGSYYVSPVLVFNGGHAFHSRTYVKETGKLLDPTMGKPASHGCIRMLDEDVQWLEAYLPMWSTVVVY